MSNKSIQSRFNEAKDTCHTLKELAHLLGVDLDMETLSLCTRLCEAGVDPQTLAMVVNKLQQEVKQAESKNGSNEN